MSKKAKLQSDKSDEGCLMFRAAFDNTHVTTMLMENSKTLYSNT